MIYYMNKTEKKTYVITTPVSRIFLSVNLVKTLDSFGVRTLDDMLQLGQDVICHIWGLTMQDKEEIQGFMDHLWSAPDGFRLCAGSSEVAEFLEAERTDWPIETPLDVLGLSQKIIHALLKAGITSVEALQETDQRQLQKMHLLGEKFSEDIDRSLQAYLQKVLNPQDITSKRYPAKLLCIDFLQKLSNYCSVLTLRVYGELEPLFYSAFLEERDVDFVQVYETPSLRKILRNELLSKIEKELYGISIQDLRTLIPEELLPSKALHSMLQELEQDGKVTLNNGIVQESRPRALAYIAEHVSNERLQDILVQRIRGASLEELAPRHSISIERIRQLTARWYMTKENMLYEDMYIPVYQKYLFTKKDFTAVFNEPEETYHYLSMVTKKGKQPFADMYNDPAIPDTLWQRGWEEMHIILDGTTVSKRRNALIEHLIFSHFQDGGTITALFETYSNVLKESGLERDPAFMLTSLNSLVDMLSDSDILLYKRGRQLRYYDIWKNDYTQLLEELKLEQYQNTEISTKKLWEEHQALMNTYDIRDGFELHNLLRRISVKHPISGLTFRRMPNLEFGMVRK